MAGWLFVGAAGVAAQGLSPAQDPSTAAARDENLRRCEGASADLRITGCTALIQSGQETPRDLAAVYHNRANATRAKGMFDLALQDDGEAIKLDPRFIDALGSRGITLTAMGRYADAIPDFTRVIDLDPAGGYAFYVRGIAYEGLGLDDLAIDDFSAAIAGDSRDARRFERRGTAYFRKAQYDKALADYEQSLNLDPQSAAALYGRGVLKRMNGDIADGAADLAQARQFQHDIDRVMTLAGVKQAPGP